MISRRSPGRAAAATRAAAALVLVALALAIPPPPVSTAPREPGLLAETRLREPASVGPVATMVYDLIYRVAGPGPEHADDVDDLEAPAAPPRPVRAFQLEMVGGLERRPLVARLDGIPAREALAALAESVGGEWLKTPRGWMLTDRPDLRYLAVLSPYQLGGRRLPVPPLGWLTPRNWRLLFERGTLYPADLSLVGRRGFQEMARKHYHNRSPRIAEEALDLDGCRMALQVVRKSGGSIAALDLDLEFAAPEGERRRMNTLELGRVVSEPEGLEIRRRVGAQRDWWAPSRLPARPAARTAPADLRAAGLQRPARIGPGSLFAVLMALAAQDLSLVACTWFRHTPVRPPKPELPLGEHMRLAAEAIGGEWHRVGTVYALRTNPLVERCAQLEPNARDRWRAVLAARVRETLTASQRQRLRAPGHLAAGKLREEQRIALAWLTALEFVTFRRLDARCLRAPAISLERRGERLEAVYRQPQGDGELGRLALGESP